MKITEEDYNTIRDEVAKLDVTLINKHKETVLASGKFKNFEERIRWDILSACHLSSFISETLYKYLNDDHIDTALRSIVKELKLI